MMKSVSKGVFIAGVWVLISPWVLGFSSINLAFWSNCIAGLVIIGLSFRFFRSQKQKGGDVNHQKSE